jgi:hypothetical protein
MSAQTYPLQWPDHIPRSSRREKGLFRTNSDQALKNVVKSLKLFAADSRRPISEAVMSSNISLLESKPPDPGVAVWFTWDGMSVCIPVDRYDTPAANLQAIHHVIEARRVELRHGTLNLVRASFQGFRALPPPDGKGKRPWWEVLELPPNSLPVQIEAVYRRLAKERHPDAGGSDAAMAELNEARKEALAR